MTSDSKGFVALLTVLILSAVLLVIVVSVAQYGIGTRFSLLDLENKTASESLANACVAVARIAVVNDPEWDVTNRVVDVDTHSCTIESVSPNTPSGSQSRVKVSAVVDGATTNFLVDIEETTGAITRFLELTS